MTDHRGYACTSTCGHVQQQRPPYRPTTRLDWQEKLDEAIRGCLSTGMSVNDVAEWVSDSLRGVEADG